jgi:hypothetical protein
VKMLNAVMLQTAAAVLLTAEMIVRQELFAV